MRFPRSYLRVDLTKLFCEDSDSSGHSEDEEEIMRSREWRPGKENGQNGYPPQMKENIDPWTKILSQVKNLPPQEHKSTSYDKFVREASNVESKSRVKFSSGEKDKEKEKTYRIQTIGEVYALQKREGRELPVFRGIKESRSRNTLTKRLTLRKINEPLLMGTGYASYKSRNSARGKEWNGGRNNDFVYGYQDPGEDEAYATWFPENDHDEPTPAEHAQMNSAKASARPSVQPHIPDTRNGNGQSSILRKTLPSHWNQTTGDHPPIHETHPALLESEMEALQAPPADAATLHSEMFPALYGGYGFPYEGPFYNPIVAPPLFPYPMAPPYPIGSIFPIGFPYPVPLPYPVECRRPTPPRPTADTNGQQLQLAASDNTYLEASRKLKRPQSQYLDPEAIPWIPGSTPFTSNMPISVIKKARSPDFYLLQGLEYVSLRESEEKRRDKPENKPQKKVEIDVVNGCRTISAAEYAGILVQNMTEETNPLLTKYLNPGKNRFHEARRYVSMPDGWGSQRKKPEEIGSRRQSWSHPGCLDETNSLD
ncbi:hypothetical protein L873DRAFT_1100268 [Choiromyces venosus 120613-1]|uniref:Uncharacterized protein n=1 Tax=Choiromyces venosus 120613-1 TaxID=1336337 RepID=A0A3N4JMJ5_9PEZI|nr:hypothetical protein L873DRAFT_1100268 [Choiromyces venosus 120613-1]